MQANERLATYLNDHLAGSVIALEMLADLDDDPVLADLRREILADREVLERLLARTGAEISQPRQAAAWLAEKLGDVKFYLDDPDQGALRRLEMLETVSLGIAGKAALWSALQHARTGNPLLRTEDFTALRQRADQQRERLEPLRLAAANAAFAEQTPAAGAGE
ncbi:MAG: hypothetical protein KC442_09490 [Thermomicrobiales bacterium]|nr:hypothetical protein [Thermomicrobiales bacterium]